MAEVTEQIVREAPEIEAYKLGLLKSAQALQAPNLPNYQVAGMTQDQLNAMETGRSGIGAYAPFLQSGSQALTSGQAAIGEAGDIMRGADTRGQFGAAQQAANAAAAGTLQQAQPIGQEQISQYMNPFTNLALQQQLQEMSRQGQIQQQGLNAQSVMAGAFGGSRQGIAEQELNRNLMQTQNQAIANSMQGNYAQALSAAQQQQGAGMAGYGQLANIGQGIGSLANQQFGVGQGLAQGIAGLGSQLGNIGVQQAALGAQEQQLGQNDVNFLYNMGSAGQRQSQAELDALRASQTQTALQPQQQLAFLSDIYKGAPSSQMSVTQQQQPTPSPFQQIAGLATGTVGTLAAGKSAGIF
tara:strand:+ start:568 stop:1632 length:1065 start_codon:yes stop_codon:yes gene_type:complete